MLCKLHWGTMTPTVQKEGFKQQHRGASFVRLYKCSLKITLRTDHDFTSFAWSFTIKHTLGCFFEAPPAAPPSSLRWQRSRWHLHG